MQVRLLGPVDVVVGGQPRAVTGLRRKALLAALALRAGDVVNADRLIELIWGDRPPQGAGQTLQSHVSQLRRFLGDGAVIRSVPPGYLLDLAGEGTDVAVAQRLIREGSQANDPREGARLLREVVGLWRGRPLAELAGWTWFDDQARWLESMLEHATRALTDHRLALGEHAALLPELQSRARERPLDEDVQRQLMLALYRSGRQSEALEAYRALRRSLRDELGLDPGPALRDLEAAILRHDPDLSPAPDRGTAAPDPEHVPVFPVDRHWPVPAQLPAPVEGFTGREEELDWLDDAVTAAADHATAVVISALSGIAGVGKTALAVTWAHQVAPRFPDGQLYVNLRGFDPTLTALEPDSVLRGFLIALGQPARQLPPESADQISLYRSLLAGRRVLIVMDNARDAEQVRPLLPGAPGCLAVITSRNQLTPLVAAEGARSITLDLPDPQVCRELLTRRIGVERTDAEPAAVAEIIDRCGQLPLALAIAGARARTDRGVSLSNLAQQLRADTVLTTLTAGDAASDVRSVFSWSLAALPQDLARTFAVVGLHPGPDITGIAAAALAGITREEGRRRLDELARASLLTEHRPGRYTLHDLLRAYAIEQGHAQLTAPERDSATRRVLDHYTHTAQAAAQRRYGSWDHVDLPEPQPGARPVRFGTEHEASAWLDAERTVLLTLIEHAAATGMTTHAWQLAYSIGNYLGRGGFWREWARVQGQVLEASDRAHDQHGRAHAHHGLGSALTHLSQYQDAEKHLQLACELFAGLRLTDRQAQTHLAFGLVADYRHDDRAAFTHSRRALALYRGIDHRPGQAIALNNMAWSLAQLDHLAPALSLCKEALALGQNVNDPQVQAGSWDSLGYIHFRLHNLQEALACYTQAAALKHELMDRLDEAGTLLRRGDTYHALGDQTAAREDWAQALESYEELHHREAATLRQRLRDSAARPILR